MITKKEKERRLVFARELAATAWCKAKTKKKAMDVLLAEEFAKILVEEMYAPNLGCATTRELLKELTARSNLDYSTIGDVGIEVELPKPVSS